jgi:chromosome segregation ATPase
LKLNYAQFSRESYESSLNSVRLQLDGEIKRLEFELKRQREVVEAKNQEISELYRRNEVFSQELDEYRNRGDSHFILERQIVDYENKFVVFGQEIERLNIALRDCTTKLEEAQLKRREDERRIEKYEFEAREAEVKARTSLGEIAHLKDIIKRLEVESNKVSEVQQFKLQYETRITEMARESEQMSSKLRFELESSKKLREEIDRLTFELSRRSISEKEMAELKEANAELTLLRRRVAEYENKSNVLKQ